MRYCFCFILLFAYPLGSNAQSGKVLLDKMIATLKQHESLSYTASLRIKYPGSKDTSTSAATVHMLRDEVDTVWGGMVWVGEGTTFETYSFYDLDNRYVVMSAIGKVWKERARKGDMGLSIAYRYLIFQPFLQPGPFEQALQGYNMSLTGDATVNGKPCYMVRLSHRIPGTPSRTYYLNKADHFPLKIVEESTINGAIQYSIFTFTSYSFDKAGREQFSPAQIPVSYKIETRDKELPKGAQPQVRPRREWPLPGNR